MNNRDFANLFKQQSNGSSGNGKDSSVTKSSSFSGGGEKARFDLKQVANWDRELTREQEKKEKFKSDGKSKHKEKKEKDLLLPSDSVKSGKTTVKTDDHLKEKETQERIASLSTEQTKFLGGDIDHTHLVKGLDYALLEKIRAQTQQELNRLSNKITNKDSIYDDEEGNEGPDAREEEESIVKDLADVRTVTKIGQNLKNLFLKQRENEQKLTLSSFADSSSSSASASTHHVSTSSLLENLEKTGKAYIVDPTKVLHQELQKSAISSASSSSSLVNVDSVLSRSVYEYYMNPTTKKDLPLTVIKSKKVRNSRLFSFPVRLSFFRSFFFFVDLF
jgi:hypothetical protein